MTALTPYALEHIELLKRLQVDVPTTISGLATELGRDPANVRKTLIRLREDGFLQDMELTDLARDALTAYYRMVGLSAAGAPPPVFHAQIAPDTLNPRKFTAEDEEGIAELAESIARDDLLENLVIRPAGADGVHRLVAGERRWRAIARLIEDGRWARDKPVPVKIIDIDDAAHRRIALVENLQRKDLRPMDEARALKDLIDVTGMSTAKVAEEIGFTQRFVQQRLQFLELTDHQQQALNRGELSIREARNIVANKPKPLELTEAEWLIVAEVLHAVRVRPAVSGQTATLHCWPLTMDERAAMANLVGYPIALDFPRPIFEYGIESNVAKVWAGSSLPRTAVADKFGPDYLEDGLAALVAMLQIAVLGHALPEGTYATRWLNGPFETSPEVLAKIEAVKAERERQTAEQKAAHEESQRRLEVGQVAAVEFLDGRSLLSFAGILAELGAPLPWTVDEDLTFIDAKGKVVDTYDDHIVQIIALWMNKAAEVPA